MLLRSKTIGKVDVEMWMIRSEWIFLSGTQNSAQSGHWDPGTGLTGLDVERVGVFTETILQRFHVKI